MLPALEMEEGATCRGEQVSSGAGKGKDWTLPQRLQKE